MNYLRVRFLICNSKFQGHASWVTQPTFRSTTRHDIKTEWVSWNSWIKSKSALVSYGVFTQTAVSSANLSDFFASTKKRANLPQWPRAVYINVIYGTTANFWVFTVALCRHIEDQRLNTKLYVQEPDSCDPRAIKSNLAVDVIQNPVKCIFNSKISDFPNICSLNHLYDPRKTANANSL